MTPDVPPQVLPHSDADYQEAVERVLTTIYSLADVKHNLYEKGGGAYVDVHTADVLKQSGVDQIKFEKILAELEQADCLFNDKPGTLALTPTGLRRVWLINRTAAKKMLVSTARQDAAKWEYKIIQGSTDRAERLINDLASHGWEFASASVSVDEPKPSIRYNLLIVVMRRDTTGDTWISVGNSSYPEKAC